jgi:peptidoglycan/xylan/chitin deacetylase (PgdA/CDA1 family)
MELKLNQVFKYFLFKDSYFFCLLLKVVAHIISPFGASTKITVLIYHHVLIGNNLFDNNSVDKACFRWQMRLIKRIFNVITLDQAVEFLNQGVIPRRAIVITFDEGYTDNLTHAQPILQEYDLPCTYFITGAAITSGHLWNEDINHALEYTHNTSLDLQMFDLGVLSTLTHEDKRSTASIIIEKFKYQTPSVQAQWVKQLILIAGSPSAPRQLLTAQQLLELSNCKGVTIGCHTMTHPMFSYISAEVAKQDVLDCKQYLTELVKKPIEHFAYPYGEYGKHFHAEHMNVIASLDFKSAVTTDEGAVEQQSSFYMIKRFTPLDKKPIQFFMRLCLNFNK